MLHLEKWYFSRMGVGHLNIDWYYKWIRKVGNTVFLETPMNRKLTDFFFFGES